MTQTNPSQHGISLFLSAGFRPFFLLSGLWSTIAMSWWIAILMLHAPLPSTFEPYLWHIHEMLFGFVGAAVAGFLLTAIPNWTGRPAIKGAPLAALALIWIAGRVAALTQLPRTSAMAIEILFYALLAGMMLREIVGSKNWRNLPMAAPVIALGVADALMCLPDNISSASSDLAWRLGLAAIVILISAIGGRIIPNFTRNWLTARQVIVRPATSSYLDRIAMATLHPGLIGWAFYPSAKPVAILLIVGAIINLIRLVRWRGYATLAEPLLVILHIGYLWLIVGAALAGASILTAAVPEVAAVHAFTAGAIGTMTLAVMTRATRGHTGHPLRADRATSLIYLMVIAAAIARVCASFAPSLALPLLGTSGGLWIASFLMFSIIYGRILITSAR